MTAPATTPLVSPSLPAEALPRWTLARMDVFVRALRHTGNVAAAARAAGMSRQAAYRLRARLAGHPFDQAWTAATAPHAAVRRVAAAWQEEQGGQAGQGVTPGDRG